MNIPRPKALYGTGGLEMKKALSLASALLASVSLTAFAGSADKSIVKSPPAAPYQQVSKLVPLPDFLPGMGQLFVDPATLPAGPFLAYDHDKKLVSTIYMVPLKDINPDNSFDNLSAPGGNVDHVDVYYNAGHPGVGEPHAHIVMWHIPADKESRVAK
ncbi:hypothetical protein JCM17845_09620 [Iodidimonas gelatinilytica]|uniref:YbhB/YbcL family Raf kinase inhibitor-like protein n=2 Tax=Iodidimonas gelatinilytica TaxID=1236966 RepID=A0A5A7MZE1_9PROT|nr:hypothetical protein JCM17845_09620 [Iodidimonas gelatinilytica]